MSTSQGPPDPKYVRSQRLWRLVRRAAFAGLVVALFAVVGYFLQGAPQTACSCAIVDPKVAVTAAPGVFIGTPTRVLHGRDSDLYEFQVTEVFHGEVGSTTTVATSSTSDCGTSFTIGRPSLLLAAAPYSVGADWQAHGCGPDVSATELRAVAQAAYGPAHAPTAGGDEITTWTRFNYKVPHVLQLLILAALGCVAVAAYATRALHRHAPLAAAPDDGDTIAR
ncbi:hypothetical protein ACFVUS_07325 [Nocardia sp. NPDC058058]|uniref:hypothetical protein n=1 Tax=Nocardia sp. NPDC058058 TaxID=3346317 RepID=UPI0036DA2F5F